VKSMRSWADEPPDLARGEREPSRQLQPSLGCGVGGIALLADDRPFKPRGPAKVLGSMVVVNMKAAGPTFVPGRKLWK